MADPSALEKATLRRVSFRLLPFLMLAYLVCYIDRVNVGFASLQMNKAVGIDPKTYGYLGFRTIVVKDHREPGLLPVKQGQITGWGALMTASFVAKPGSRG